MTRLSVATTPCRQWSVAATEIDGHAVLLDDSTGSRLVLDQLASLVWSLLDGRSTLGELVEDLSEAYEASSARVREDVFALVQRLASDGFVHLERAGRHRVPRRSVDDTEVISHPRYLDRAEST